MTKTTTFESDFVNLGFCPPTPPLTQHFALSERLVLMLT